MQTRSQTHTNKPHLRRRPVPEEEAEFDDSTSWSLEDTDSSSDYEPETTPFSEDIDFDEASVAWRANKKPIGNGSFKYVTKRKTLAPAPSISTSRMVLRSRNNKA
jgi:hypothetical protein